MFWSSLGAKSWIFGCDHSAKPPAMTAHSQILLQNLSSLSLAFAKHTAPGHSQSKVAQHRKAMITDESHMAIDDCFWSSHEFPWKFGDGEFYAHGLHKMETNIEWIYAVAAPPLQNSLEIQNGCCLKTGHLTKWCQKLKGPWSLFPIKWMYYPRAFRPKNIRFKGKTLLLISGGMESFSGGLLKGWCWYGKESFSSISKIATWYRNIFKSYSITRSRSSLWMSAHISLASASNTSSKS